MLEVAIFLEGQNGLNWPRWQRIAEAVERLGYAGLYRSDLPAPSFYRAHGCSSG